LATTDDVFNLLKAVNEVTLKRMEEQTKANSATLKRIEDLINAVNSVTLKRIEDQIKAINSVTLKRMEDRLIDIQKKVKDDDD
jgi:allophanate hydrolase subunit 1